MTEYKRNPNTACILCGKKIYRRPGVLEQSKGKVYCSQICYGKSCRQEVPCVVCAKLMLSSANKKTCSRTCANKNHARIKYTRRQKKDNVVTKKHLKIRLLAKRGKQCVQCGYAKVTILQIHHKDRDQTNNKLTNLELLCPNCHAEATLFKN